MTEAPENPPSNNSMTSNNPKDVGEKPQGAPSGDSEYPPQATVLITVAALMVTQFLVALVYLAYVSQETPTNTTTTRTEQS